MREKVPKKSLKVFEMSKLLSYNLTCTKWMRDKAGGSGEHDTIWLAKRRRIQNTYYSFDKKWKWVCFVHLGMDGRNCIRHIWWKLIEYKTEMQSRKCLARSRTAVNLCCQQNRWESKHCQGIPRRHWCMTRILDSTCKAIVILPAPLGWDLQDCLIVNLNICWSFGSLIKDWG